MISGIRDEIARLTIASCSIDHGGGANTHKLDIPAMEHALLALRAYRAVMLSTAPLEPLNLAEGDETIRQIRADLLGPKAAAA